jgi:hypothetical protein
VPGWVADSHCGPCGTQNKEMQRQRTSIAAQSITCHRQCTGARVMLIRRRYVVGMGLGLDEIGTQVSSVGDCGRT